MKNAPSVPMYALSGIHSFLKSPLASIAFSSVMKKLAPSIPYVRTFTNIIIMSAILPNMLSEYSHSFHNGTARRDIFDASKTCVRNLCISALTDLPFAMAASYILPASFGFSVTSYMAYTVFGTLFISEKNRKFNINELLYNCVAQPILYFTYGKLGWLLGTFKHRYNLREVTDSDAIVESNKVNTIQITDRDLLELFNNIKERLKEKGYNNHIDAIKFYVSESPGVTAFAVNLMSKDPIIAVSKGMIAKLIAANNTKEDVINQLTAIMAHECGHITLNHTSALSDFAKHTLDWVLPSSNLGSTIFDFNSQRHEYQADNVSFKVMGESESLSKGLSVACGYIPLNNEGMIASLLRTFTVFTTSVMGLLSTTTHPHTANRIAVIDKSAAEMPQQEHAVAALER